MEQGQVIQVAQDAVVTILSVAAPLLGIALVIGVVVSIFQATTQINEQTLAFVPKIVGVFLALLIFGGWMLSAL
ncbi:MAG: flagellar biosynthesis protein FliQ, partial [Clostridiales bacterium]|nr:flagellar biosynthesis protein FliQ [Clostridiales bacterium]